MNNLVDLSYIYGYKQIGGNDKKIITTNKINKIYGNKYRFNYISKNGNLIHIFTYITKNFKFKKKPNFITFKKLSEDGNSDNILYNYLRKRYIDEKDIIYNHDNQYDKHIINKVNKIYNNLHKYDIKFNKILDIGTENSLFLDKIKSIFNSIKVDGLNIINGYSHYNSYYESIKTGKIILYDGINIPFEENEYDLVTLIAVIHHIENLDVFLHNLCKITKSIYIKDNDMINDITKYYIEIQHELYEGILYPNDRSPLYYITNDMIVQILQKNGFLIKINKITDEFTRPYKIFAIKKDNSDFGSKSIL